ELGGWEALRSAGAAPPNKRLKLAGAYRLKGHGLLCPDGYGRRPTPLRRRASRPQLKRDPLGGPVVRPPLCQRGTGSSCSSSSRRIILPTDYSRSGTVPEPAAYPDEARLNILYRALEVVDLQPLIDACQFQWYNQTLCKVNDSVVRLGWRSTTSRARSEEHTSELQSLAYFVCR